MFPFRLDSLSAKEIYDGVLIRLVEGKKLTLNYFELKTKEVKIPEHSHPVEHLVVVLKGEMEFLFEDKKLNLKEKECLFVPAKIRHTAKVIIGPVKALEIFPNKKDKYYEI